MAAPVSVNDFLELARKSGVLDEQQFAKKFGEGEDLPDAPQGCAAALIKAGLLTNFQAKQLLAGKTRGFLLGPYKVLTPIGQGGMGVVYLAEHASLHRKVALKVLPPDKAKDKLALERFLREARSSAALDHPNIVRLFDIGNACGVNFLVMEYAQGTTLQSLMEKTGPLHYVQAVQYIAQAAAGLQHAHNVGVIHRDIKPANLMLCKDGTVKILDMGLARSYQNESDNLTGLLGSATDVAGSIDFVSPEQALGGTLDARADVYSLGATFYALIAGQPPFQGSPAQKLMQHQMNEPPKLAKVRAGLPPGLGDVLAKMIAKRPEDRYQSGEEVIDALGPWLAAASTGSLGRIVTASTPVASTARIQPKPVVEPEVPEEEDLDDSQEYEEIVTTPKRQLPWQVYAGVGAAAAFLVGVGGVIFLAGGSKKNNPTAGVVVANDAKQEAVSGEKPVGLPTFKAIENRRFSSLNEKIERLALSRDGKLLAACGDKGTIAVWEVATGRLKHSLAGHNGPVHFASFSPDGTRLAAAGAKDPTVRIWDLGTESKIAESVKLVPSAPDWWVTMFTPEGNRVVSITDGKDAGKLFLWDADTGKSVASVDLKTKARMAAIAPDGATIAVCGPSAKEVTLYDVATGGMSTLPTSMTVIAVAFSPDGKWILAGGAKTGGTGGVAQLFDRATGQPAGEPLPVPTKSGTGSAFSTRVWTSFSPSGRSCAASGGGTRVLVWDTETGSPICDFNHADKTSITTVLFAGEKQVVTSGNDGTVILWDLTAEN